MSSHDIEDVLSSIRRLVSEDLRPASPRPTATATVENKLILTPALRVVTPPTAAPQETDAAMVQDTGPDADRLSGDRIIFASQRTPAIDPAPEPEHEAAVSDGDALPAAVMPAAAMSESAIADAPMSDVSAWSDDIWDEPTVRPAVAEDADAGFEETGFDGTSLNGAGLNGASLNGASLDRASPDGAGLDGAGIARDLPASDATEPEAPMWTGADEAEVWAQPGQDWVEEDPIPFAATPPRRPPVASDPLAMAWADRAEADARAELETSVEERLSAARTSAHAARTGEIDPADMGLLADEGTPFDEEALRDLVRDIIREELAGTLGERITRNVRKLVRVEINRALATRDFE